MHSCTVRVHRTPYTAHRTPTVQNSAYLGVRAHPTCGLQCAVCGVRCASAVCGVRSAPAVCVCGLRAAVCGAMASAHLAVRGSPPLRGPLGCTGSDQIRDVRGGEDKLPAGRTNCPSDFGHKVILRTSKDASFDSVPDFAVHCHQIILREPTGDDHPALHTRPSESEAGRCARFRMVVAFPLVTRFSTGSSPPPVKKWNSVHFLRGRRGEHVENESQRQRKRASTVLHFTLDRARAKPVDVRTAGPLRRRRTSRQSPKSCTPSQIGASQFVDK